jgi:hypothetical protein
MPGEKGQRTERDCLFSQVPISRVEPPLFPEQRRQTLAVNKGNRIARVLANPCIDGLRHHVSGTREFRSEMAHRRFAWQREIALD